MTFRRVEERRKRREKELKRRGSVWAVLGARAGGSKGWVALVALHVRLPVLAVRFGHRPPLSTTSTVAGRAAHRAGWPLNDSRRRYLGSGHTLIHAQFTHTLTTFAFRMQPSQSHRPPWQWQFPISGQPPSLPVHPAPSVLLPDPVLRAKFETLAADIGLLSAGQPIVQVQRRQRQSFLLPEISPNSLLRGKRMWHPLVWRNCFGRR